MKRTTKFSKKCPACNAESADQELTDTEFEGRDISEYWTCLSCDTNYTKHFAFVETEISD